MRPVALAAALVLVAACGQTPAEPAHTGTAPSSSVEVPSVARPGFGTEAAAAVPSTQTSVAKRAPTPPPTTTAPPTTTTTTTAPPEPELGPATITEPGRVPVERVEAAIVAHFPDVPGQALRVATCESRLDNTAVGRAGERGPFQIHPIWRHDFPRVTGVAWADAFDPDANARFARWLFNQSRWKHWTCQP